MRVKILVPVYISLAGFLVGGAAHADDVRAISTNITAVGHQDLIIKQFTEAHEFKLNLSKCELVRMNKTTRLDTTHINGQLVPVQSEAKCWLLVVP